MLWPSVVAEYDFEGFDQTPEPPVEEEIVSIGRSMGLEVDEADVVELVEEHAEELTTEELKELQKIAHMEVMQELSSEEEVEEEKVLTSREIREILGMWQKVSDFVEKRHPEKLHTGRASAYYNDTCLTHFRNILKKRQKQTSLDHFLIKRPRSPSVEGEKAKRAKSDSGSD